MLTQVSQELSAVGLILRGWFAVKPEDGLAPLEDGGPIKSAVLVGNAGPGFWRAFAAQPREGRDPLDRWTEAVLSPIAQRLGARVAFPFQRPYLPFQQWAARAEPCHPSPIGMFIHPRYGLWHALRGVFLLADELPEPEFAHASSPCLTCEGQFCLTSCPVQAFQPHAYDVPRCGERLRSQEGRDCMALGCRARRACPVGRDYCYSPEQANFHMESFLRVLGG